MAIDFSKFDKTMDLAGLKNDLANAASTDKTEYDEVPVGRYEVEIQKLELTESKSTKNPMVTCWMKILEGDYKGSMLFMNQVITQGFQIHIVNKFLRSLVEDMDINVEFVSYADYAELLLDISEKIDGTREYLVEYGSNKGFNTFEIVEVYDVE